MSSSRHSPKTHRDPPLRFDDEGTLYERPQPPSQPQGWADPDPLFVEPEEVDPRVPYSGWDSMRHRWALADQTPISRGAAWLIVALCFGLIFAVVILLVAAPRPATTTAIPAEFQAPAGSLDPIASSGNLSSSPAGAPHTARAARGDGLLGDIGGAPLVVAGRYTAQATYCAPTPDYCQSWGPPAHLAAVYSFRFGHQPYWARVWRGEKFTTVLVVSHCACHRRHDRIDLSPAAFDEIAARRLGRVSVEVETLAWPYEPGGDPPPHPDDEEMRLEDRPLPATDVAP